MPPSALGGGVVVGLWPARHCSSEPLSVFSMVDSKQRTREALHGCDASLREFNALAHLYYIGLRTVLVNARSTIQGQRSGPQPARLHLHAAPFLSTSPPPLP